MKHGKPVTRRDFLAQGLITGSGYIMAPTVLGMMLRSGAAWGALCDDASGVNGLPAVLVIDHAGGAALLAQTTPLAAGDQPLSVDGYRSLGMPPGQDPTTASVTDNSWGLNLHKNLAFATQLNSIAIADAKARTNGFSILAQLGDDTSNNMINPVNGLALLGAVGDTDRKVAPVIGTSTSETGGNSSAAVSAPLFRSVPVRNAQGAANLVSVGVLTSRLNNSRALASRVMKAMQNMTSSQLKRYSEQDLPTQVKDLVSCGYVKASSLTGDPAPGVPSLNPSDNPLVAQVFDITNQTEEQAATLTYLLAQGFSGAATLELGGRDYHDNTRSTGESLDAEAARITAKAINLFHRLITEGGARPRPLMVIHITDGGLSTAQQPDANANGFFAWASDRGSASAALVFVYDPSGKPNVSRPQLGYASPTDGGVDRTATPFSGTPVAFAEVMMANWLQFAGRAPSDLAKSFTTTLTPAQLAQYAILTRKS